MSLPLISIVTACFNSQDTLKETLESVLHQSYDRIEYIIIDGESTDDTINIIASYESKFKKRGISYRWLSEPDQGIYDALNKGIALANGELIGIIGSDDWYELDGLKLVAECYKKTAAHLIHGNMNLYSIENKFIKKVKPEAIKNMSKRMTFFHPASFLSKNIYEALQGYSLDYKISSDYDFFLKLLRKDYKIYYLDKEITNFSLAGISNSNATEALYESHLIRISLGYNYYRSLYYFKQAQWVLLFKKLFKKA